MHGLKGANLTVTTGETNQEFLQKLCQWKVGPDRIGKGIAIRLGLPDSFRVLFNQISPKWKFIFSKMKKFWNKNFATWKLHCRAWARKDDWEQQLAPVSSIWGECLTVRPFVPINSSIFQWKGSISDALSPCNRMISQVVRSPHLCQSITNSKISPDKNRDDDSCNYTDNQYNNHDDDSYGL